MIIAMSWDVVISQIFLEVSHMEYQFSENSNINTLKLGNIKNNLFILSWFRRNLIIPSCSNILFTWNISDLWAEEAQRWELMCPVQCPAQHLPKDLLARPSHWGDVIPSLSEVLGFLVYTSSYGILSALCLPLVSQTLILNSPRPHILTKKESIASSSIF